MFKLDYPELEVSFTAEELALECISVLRDTEYSERWPENFPELHCTTPRNMIGQKCVGFFADTDEFTEPLSVFSKRYIVPAMSLLKYRMGVDGELSECVQELPGGCFSANAVISGFGSLRAILMQEPVPESLRYPSLYPRGIIKRYFDINR